MSISKSGVVAVRFARSASFILVASAFAAACGARSGIDCLGETCRSLDDDDARGFDPDDDLPGAGAGGSSGRAGSAGGGSGGRGSGGRGGRAGTGSGGGPVPPEQLPPDTPVDSPVASLCDPGGVFEGSIDVSTQAELQSLEGCTGIDGDLTIFGTNLQNLVPLQALRFVDGLLSISDYSGSLDGLDALERVNSLTLENALVRTLAPLRSLREIRGRLGSTLSLTRLPNLVDLDGLDGLEQLDDIFISENDALATLAGLGVPPELATLRITNNPRLVSLGALDALQTAKSVEIEGSPLESLAGLGNLRAVGSLVLANDTSLASVDLPRLEALDVLYLDNVAATTLGGLGSLRGLVSAIIQNNGSLVEVDQLGALESLGELSVINNLNLQRLPTFSGVVSLEQLHIRNNPLLTSGPGYPLVEEAGTVLISENASLSSLTGFAALQRVRSIDISRNASLSEVDLGTLGSARTVRIVCNAALPELPLETMLGDVSGTIDVWGNQGSETSCP